MKLFENICEGIPNDIQIPMELEKLCDWAEQNGYPISGYFEIRPDDGETMRYWLGSDDVSHRFGIFGAGSSGEIYAIWKDDTGKQKIVHLGSEGDSLIILADDFVDFLRLLAIGYNDLGYDDLTKSLEELGQNGYDMNGKNQKFTNWVEKEFVVKIPRTGNEIVDVNNKEFESWIEEQQQKYSQ